MTITLQYWKVGVIVLKEVAHRSGNCMSMYGRIQYCCLMVEARFPACSEVPLGYASHHSHLIV